MGARGFFSRHCNFLLHESIVIANRYHGGRVVVGDISNLRHPQLDSHEVARDLACFEFFFFFSGTASQRRTMGRPILRAFFIMARARLQVAFWKTMFPFIFSYPDGMLHFLSVFAS